MSIGKPLENVHSLWAILKGYRKAGGKCPNASCQPRDRKEAALPRGYWQNERIFNHFH
jgi:hypothetical protein